MLRVPRGMPLPLWGERYMKTLETERLILRGWRLEDLDDLYECMGNPNVGPIGGWEPHASREMSSDALRSFIEDGDRWAIALKETGKAIGAVRLYPDEKRGQLSERNGAFLINYFLAEAYWGRGYMTEAVKRVVDYAFDEMGIELLGVSHRPGNDRSKRVIEKCGFHYDGIIERGSKNYDGQLFDSVCYSIRMSKPSVEALPAKEFLVIKNYGKLYGEKVTPDPDSDPWINIRRWLRDGTIERLQRAAGSEAVYMLFCNTCVHSDDEKCYVCGYDIACENLNGAKAADGFELVRLGPCEYAVYAFGCDAAMPDMHEISDDLFWGKWLKKNPYTSAIDDPANWSGNGCASMELYTPFDPDGDRFKAKIWYPIIKKKEKPT